MKKYILGDSSKI